MRISARGGTLAEMHQANDEILAACVRHDLTAWVVDHFQFDDLPIMECFSLLAHSAGRQPGLRFGTLVVGQSFRNPALTAKIAATLQMLSGGRFTLGIGAGWKEDEYRAYGYPYPAPSVRIEQLAEAVQIIQAMWRATPASFAGRHYQIDNAYCEPRPDPAPILMIGGAGEQRTLRVVARYADWWNADYYSPDDYARKLEILRRYCQEIGREPNSVVPTYYATVSIARDPAAVSGIMPLSHRTDLYCVSGSPDQVTQQLEQFAALGVQHVQLTFTDFPRLEGMRLFLSDVLPRFRRIGQRG